MVYRYRISDGKNTVRVNLTLPAELYARLREHCQEEGALPEYQRAPSVSSVVAEAVEKWLAAEGR
jgi:hypothetical protein